MNLRRITYRERRLFTRFLGLKEHRLSSYSFENIYIWKELFDIRWAVIEESLCIFFRDKIGCFLYLPPLSKSPDPQAVSRAFKLMGGFNKNSQVSRIENIEDGDVAFYESLGYFCRNKFPEYLCLRRDLAELKGDRFKAKRACCNYFIKNYRFECLPFSLKYKTECLKLYGLWAAGRKAASSDRIYQGLLGDSRVCLETMLSDYRQLGLRGSLVAVDGKISGFTFGFPLNKDTFCVLYEITDLKIRGLAQFIFREFCRKLDGYKHINIMDDCGLKNLERVKLSYHPKELILAYTAARQNA